MMQAALSLLLLLLCHLSWADVSMPSLFANNMVLQQKADAKLWGWADPGEKIKITVDWDKRPVKVVADAEGKWLATVRTATAGGPYKIQVKGNNTIELEDVLLGEVWLASGQSNMNFNVAKGQSWHTGVENYEQEVAQANYPTIRMFTVEQKSAAEPQKDVNGEWVSASPETVGGFSAVAYFFAREIQKEKKVPVGIIHSSWGGTPAEAWTKKEVLAADPIYQPILNRFQEKLAANPESASSPRNNQAPSRLYNAMIAPLVPYTIKGVLWYQGESNADRAYQYRRLFPAMIESWRKDWKVKQLPFYFVQIAPHRSQHPEIREAQLMTYRTVPNTGMVVTTDAGDSLDIHPRNKQVVGERLARWALARHYGKKELVPSGPLYKSMKVQKDKIRISFDFAESGLEAKGGDLKGFTIAGPDQQFVPAQARIEGNEVIVWSDQVKKPVAVRYGWSHVPRVNLYNKAGLPASPFRTDIWKGETEGKY